MNTILILLAASLIAVGLIQRLGLSPIIGFLLVGIIVGPHGLHWVESSDQIQQMAEFGVVFLMFTIGLEFSLPRLVADRATVLGTGSLQLIITAGVIGLCAWLFELGITASITVGMALAMSSTAIVMRLLLERAELNTRYGRTAFCILLFQDLATIIFLLVFPVLANGTPLDKLSAIAALLVKGVLVFLILILIGRRIIRPFFRQVAAYHSPELFMLAVFMAGLGAAQFANVMGLSMALGGFMAGMVLGETEFRHQVEADIRPFQDILLGLFFITIGMLVNLELFTRIWPSVLALAVALIAVKAVIVTGLVLAKQYPLATAIRTGVVLAQGGEFSLVILFLALRMGVLTGLPGQIILSAVLLSMAVAPVLIRYNVKIAERLAGVSLQQTQQTLSRKVEQLARDVSSHVILCGYGRVGQNIARLLAEEGVDYVALDLDPYRLKATTDAGERVSYGNATRRQILIAAGLERAEAVVITFNDTHAALIALGHIHELRPDITVLVRAADEASLEELYNSGATEVIPDTLESSLTLAAHVLTLRGIPMSKVARRSAEIRSDRYRLLRGFFHGRERAPPHARLQVVIVTNGAYAVGRTLKQLDLQNYGVTVTAVRRHGIRGASPVPEMRIEAEDALILYGRPHCLERVARYLITGEK
jgi:CPA2 family monovalent cation:H+ antiporter-2